MRGLRLDNAQSWPLVMPLDTSELGRTESDDEDEGGRASSVNQYSPQEVSPKPTLPDL